MTWNSKIDGNAGFTPPPKPAAPRRYRCRLDNVGDVKRELSKVYREARSAVLPIDQAYKLSSILATLSKSIEGAEIDAINDRLDRLTAATAPPAARRAA